MLQPLVDTYVSRFLLFTLSGKTAFKCSILSAYSLNTVYIKWTPVTCLRLLRWTGLCCFGAVCRYFASPFDLQEWPQAHVKRGVRRFEFKFSLETTYPPLLEDSRRVPYSKRTGYQSPQRFHKSATRKGAMLWANLWISSETPPSPPNLFYC